MWFELVMKIDWAEMKERIWARRRQGGTEWMTCWALSTLEFPQRTITFDLDCIISWPVFFLYLNNNIHCTALGARSLWGVSSTLNSVANHSLCHPLRSPSNSKTPKIFSKATRPFFVFDKFVVICFSKISILLFIPSSIECRKSRARVW